MNDFTVIPIVRDGRTVDFTVSGTPGRGSVETAANVARRLDPLHHRPDQHPNGDGFKTAGGVPFHSTGVTL